MITGCNVIPMNSNPQNLLPSKSFIDADLRLITISMSDHADTDLISSIQVETAWKNSLEKALFTKKIFSDNSKRKVNIDINVTKYIVGITQFDVHIIAEYKIVDRNSDKIIHSEVIDSKGNSNLFFGLNRSNESNGMAIRANIEKYIAKLEEYALENQTIQSSRSD